MAQIVTHTAAAFDKLHLFLIDTHDPAVAVGLTVKTYYKTI